MTSPAARVKCGCVIYSQYSFLAITLLLIRLFCSGVTAAWTNIIVHGGKRVQMSSLEASAPGPHLTLREPSRGFFACVTLNRCNPIRRQTRTCAVRCERALVESSAFWAVYVLRSRLFRALSYMAVRKAEHDQDETRNFYTMMLCDFSSKFSV